MAQKVLIELVDDLDGSSEANETVSFSLDGKDYEIDLSENHAIALRESFADYIPAARKAGASSKPTVASNRERVRAVREWGQANGFKIADRGRVPAEVWQAYEKSS